MLNWKKINLNFKLTVYFSLFIAILLFSYSRVPNTFLYSFNEIQLPQIEQKSLFIIFPSYWGNDIHVDRLIEVVKESDQIFGQRRYVICYDYKKYLGSILQAALNAENIGKILGEQVASMARKSNIQDLNSIDEHRKLKIVNIHVVGISIGAFAADAFVKAYKSKIIELYGSNVLSSVSLNLTFLDPYVNRGFFERNYGVINFGLDADYTEQYLNTDDPIPFTNQPLQNAYTIDVTNSLERKEFQLHTKETMHSWPVEYYALHWKNDLDPRLQNSHATHEDHPRGSVRVVL